MSLTIIPDIPATINDLSTAAGLAAESVRKTLSDKGLVKYAGTPGGGGIFLLSGKISRVYAL